VAGASGKFCCDIQGLMSLPVSGERLSGGVSHLQTSHTIVAHVGMERAGFAERRVLRRYVNEGSTVFRVAVILSFRGVSRGFYFSLAKLGR
jgi:hypothetical protein